MGNDSLLDLCCVIHFYLGWGQREFNEISLDPQPNLNKLHNILDLLEGLLKISSLSGVISSV